MRSEAVVDTTTLKAFIRIAKSLSQCRCYASHASNTRNTGVAHNLRERIQVVDLAPSINAYVVHPD